MRTPRSYGIILSRIPLTLFMILIFFCLIAQPRIKVTPDRTRILPGERIVLTLEADINSKENLPSLPSLPDTFRSFEVLKREKPDTTYTDNRIKITQKIFITIFDPGQWIFPSLSMDKGKSLVSSDSFQITVSAVKLTDSSYHDIREIIDVEEKSSSWKKWIAILITIIVVAGIVWNQLRDRKKPPEMSVTLEARASAYEQAQKQLKALREENLPSKGEMKVFYTRLGDIMRSYLLRQGKPMAKQQTTDELLVMLRDRLSMDQTGALASALRIADAVKFAKYPSSTEESATSMSTIEEMIRTLHNQQKGSDQ